MHTPNVPVQAVGGELKPETGELCWCGLRILRFSPADVTLGPALARPRPFLSLNIARFHLDFIVHFCGVQEVVRFFLRAFVHRLHNIDIWGLQRITIRLLIKLSERQHGACFAWDRRSPHVEAGSIVLLYCQEAAEEESAVNLLAPSGALIAIPTYYWPTTTPPHPTFSDHTGPQHWTFTFWATTAI